MTDTRAEISDGLVAGFAGYASIYNVPDRGSDVVVPGAFARSLRELRDLPLLWQHDMLVPIGRINYLAEDSKGLRVIGELTLGTRAGSEAYDLLKSGVLSGLSIGYKVIRSRSSRRGSFRELLELELLEVSLVTFPMQSLARVHALGKPQPARPQLEIVND